MKPQGLRTLIYLDGCDANDTHEVKETLGFLDGQTTNPTLLSKNPEVKKLVDSGNKFTNDSLLVTYKDQIEKINAVIGGGSVSVEVYSDDTSTVDDLVEQGKQLSQWGNHIHVKVPATTVGLQAMEELLKLGIQVNVTLCFSQEQAAAIYSQSRGFDNVYVSPFIGRIDGIGQDGMCLVENISRMFKANGDSHVKILAASIRGIDAFIRSIELGADIVTAPKSVLIEWKSLGMPLELAQPYERKGVIIPFREIPLDGSLDSYDLSHELTSKGQAQFAEDWKALLG